MSQQTEEVIHFKWDHQGDLRRFNLHRAEWQFSKLLEKIRTINQAFNDSLGYIGKFENNKHIFYQTLKEIFQLHETCTPLNLIHF